MAAKMMIFRVDLERVSESVLAQIAMQSADRSLPNSIATLFDYSDRPVPKIGYRPRNEHLKNSEGVTTHSRLGPWQVCAEGVQYDAVLPGAEFDEVWLFNCDYQPLPESENPWIPLKHLAPTVDSFGGDEAAFKAWQDSQQPETVSA